MHKDSIAYSELSSPTLITNQENMPTDQSDEILIWGSFFPGDSSWCLVGKNWPTCLVK